MSKPDRRTATFRLRHLAIAILAIVVAVAVVLNYYLW
jgi:predicted nucleic acid-binding Zn ribbon protein